MRQELAAERKEEQEEQAKEQKDPQQVQDCWDSGFRIFSLNCETKIGSQIYGGLQNGLSKEEQAPATQLAAMTARSQPLQHGIAMALVYISPVFSIN